MEEYCEVDFEYLPNGGWGTTSSTLWNTTWDVATPPDNTSDSTQASYAGWQTLLFTVDSGEVRFYVNGVLSATHGGDYYPESLMNISFNLWFISGGFAPGTTSRHYEQDIDWVFHAKDVALSSAEVDSAVAVFRNSGVVRTDTVP